jgi:signal transduction histidine kinase
MAVFRSRFFFIIVLALFVTTTAPLAALGLFSIAGYQQRSEADVDAIRDRLTEQRVESISARIGDIALRISQFLRSREKDLETLTKRARSTEAYLSFAQARTGIIWTTDAQGNEVYLDFPLFQEVSFVDVQGQEQVRVELVCYGNYPFECSIEEAAQLYDVSDPRNTRFRNEDYFAQAQQLEKGQIYVGRPIGYYVPPSESYKSGMVGVGRRHQGIVRFVTPIYEANERLGYAVMGLDTIHLMEFVAHFDANSSVPLAALGPLPVNYTYLVDNDGNTFAHPFHHLIVGVNRNGQAVDLASPDNPQGPGNFYQMGFISDVFPEMMTDFSQRSRGSYLRRLVNQEERAFIYSTIPYSSGPIYADSFGFGAIVISLRNDSVVIGSEVFSTRVANNVALLTQQFLVLVFAALLLVVIFAALIGRSIVQPIQRLTRSAAILSQRALTEAETRPLEEEKSLTEMGVLVRSFGSMGRQLREREDEVRQSLDLRENELVALSSLGQRLNAAFDLDTLLETAVEALQNTTGAAAVSINVNVQEYVLVEDADPEKITTRILPSPRSITRGQTREKPDLRIPITTEGRETGEVLLYGLPRTLEAIQRVFLDQLAALMGVALTSIQQFTRIQAQGRELALKNQRVLEATQIKSQFISTMSHELRTPLNAIAGFSSLLMDGIGLDQELTPRTLDMVRRIYLNAEHLRDMVNDVLDFAKLEAGMMSLTPHILNLRDEVEHWREQMSILAQEKGLDFRIHVAEDAPTHIVNDKKRLTQIIVNLLSNAIKFTERGEVVLDIARDGEKTVVFTVRDNGVGIPPHALNVIFERFHQVDSSNTRQQSGTGLGLSIVKSLVVLMHGTVSVSSEVGQGSVFTVRLPVEIAPPEQVVEPLE